MAKKPLYYADYLRLDDILSAQTRISEGLGNPVHDEMMFVITHQVFELWFKQILFELSSVIDLFNDAGNETALSLIHSRLNRITEIQKSLLSQMDVLKTMTPMDFLEFRDMLTPASGFQSLQYRLIETRLGLERAGSTTYLNTLSDSHRQKLEEVQAMPSLFSSVNEWLGEMDIVQDENFWLRFEIAVEEMLRNDQHIISNNPLLTDQKRQKQLENLDQLQENFSALFDTSRFENLQNEGSIRLDFEALRSALFIYLYRDKQHLHKPYQILSTLVNVDELFSTWRYEHAQLVGRMIGTKIGTGGSSGLEYLKATASTRKVFNDIRNLSSFLIPRSSLPDVVT